MGDRKQKEFERIPGNPIRKLGKTIRITFSLTALPKGGVCARRQFCASRKVHVLRRKFSGKSRPSVACKSMPKLKK